MANSKGILIAASIYPPDPGGPAVHAKAQFEGFPRFGFRTRVVALAHYRFLPRGIRHIFYFARLLSLVPKYDLVYAHDAFGAGLPAFAAARLFGKKFMIRLGGDITWEYRSDKRHLSMLDWYESGEYRGDWAFIISRWLLRHADKVVVTSPLLSVLYLKYYGITSSKIIVVPNPIPEVAKMDVPQEKIIVYASRLVGYKNLDLVLRVLAKVFPDFPELKLVIMGNGPEKERLQNLSQTLGIENNVIFTGSIPNAEVIKRTAGSLFAIAPALTEFNPNYVMQAVGLGKPFLISREHGLPFKVLEELMFNPKDERELERRIRDLLKERNYIQAVEKVKSISFRMSWEDNLKANVDLISALLKNKK